MLCHCHPPAPLKANAKSSLQLQGGRKEWRGGKKKGKVLREVMIRPVNPHYISSLCYFWSLFLYCCEFQSPFSGHQGHQRDIHRCVALRKKQRGETLRELGHCLWTMWSHHITRRYKLTEWKEWRGLMEWPPTWHHAVLSHAGTWQALLCWIRVIDTNTWHSPSGRAPHTSFQGGAQTLKPQKSQERP